ncbi:MAG: CoA transferase [Tatlockia sp.]|nr:CoA transferase [Tatlockia sp.]
MLTKAELLKEYKQNILPGPLNGLVVLGFCYYVAGPIALQSLVSQGALVIKVEKTPLGDPSRNVFSHSYFNSLTFNQLSVAIDYDDEKDKQLLASLISIADAIVDNRSVRAKKNDKILNNHFFNANKQRPQIYCSINGYPNEEVNNSPALDASIQAATGLAYTNCESIEKPLKIGVPVLDQVTGLLASNYVISNLYFLSRFPTLPESAKKMIYISVSMAGVSMWLQAGQVIRALEKGEEIFRTGNQDQFAVPFSYYTAKNGLMSVATVNEEQFKRFCLFVLEDCDFHTNYSTVQIRLEKQAQFEKDLNARLITRDREYWCGLCKKLDIPASPVLTVSQAIEQDFFKEIIHSTVDGKNIVTQGVSHSFFEKSNPNSAPSLGQHHNNFIQPQVDNQNEGVFRRARL